jgi:hypothetical protein
MDKKEGGIGIPSSFLAYALRGLVYLFFFIEGTKASYIGLTVQQTKA